jgi:hypothetical protein
MCIFVERYETKENVHTKQLSTRRIKAASLLVDHVVKRDGESDGRIYILRSAVLYDAYNKDGTSGDFNSFAASYKQ